MRVDVLAIGCLKGELGELRARGDDRFPGNRGEPARGKRGRSGLAETISVVARREERVSGELGVAFPFIRTFPSDALKCEASATGGATPNARQSSER